jgi:hypothetical protein
MLEWSRASILWSGEILSGGEEMTTDKPDIAEQLERLAKLRAEGTLSEDEFAQLKAKLIAGDTPPAPVETSGEPSSQPAAVGNRESSRVRSDLGLTRLAALVSVKFVGYLLLVGFVLVILIWLVTGHTNTSSAPDSNQAAQDQPQPTSDSAANNTVTPSTPSMPDDEAKFVAAVSAAQSTYDAAPNDMAKGRTRADRRSAICQALQGGLSANGWVGTIKTLSSNTDGKGVLEISLAPSLSVETMNNDLSDIGHNTLLASDSPILSAASAMKEGDAVVFSGTFFPSDVDCVEETSLTLEGSMQEPAFILQRTNRLLPHKHPPPHNKAKVQPLHRPPSLPRPSQRPITRQRKKVGRRVLQTALRRPMT